MAEYVNGKLSSKVLDCPYADDGHYCSVELHHHRPRKTGPTHPLAVLYCHVHGHHFTAYPPGFVPYARKQLLNGPCQHDVPSVLESVEHLAKAGPSRTPSAIGSWSTQLRLLDSVSRMFGLLCDKARLSITMAFEIPLMMLNEAASTRGVRARAQALLRLSKGFGLAELLGLGVLGGCWGPPLRWSGERDQLIPLSLSRKPP